jgi:hypothetical protein
MAGTPRSSQLRHLAFASKMRALIQPSATSPMMTVFGEQKGEQ